MPGMTFQDIILALSRYWADHGCVVLQPYDSEVGAGTFHPATTLRTLDPRPWRVAYVQPSRRPADGRYGENPNRLQHYYQFQVILMPSPDDVLDQYFGSLQSIGIDPARHDVRLVEDDWEILQKLLMSYCNLDTLDLHDNRLSSLSLDTFNKFQNLKWLQLSENNFQILPPAIGLLQQLESLDVSNNNLESLPPEIG